MEQNNTYLLLPVTATYTLPSSSATEVAQHLIGRLAHFFLVSLRVFLKSLLPENDTCHNSYIHIVNSATWL